MRAAIAGGFADHDLPSVGLPAKTCSETDIQFEITQNDRRRHARHQDRASIAATIT